MVEVWHSIRWAWLTVVVVYVVLQAIALRRLSGEFKRRSEWIWRVVMAAFIGTWSVSMVFEGRAVDRIVTLIFGAVCVGAIAVLTKAFRDQKHLGGGV